MKQTKRAPKPPRDEVVTERAIALITEHSKVQRTLNHLGPVHVECPSCQYPFLVLRLSEHARECMWIRMDAIADLRVNP